MSNIQLITIRENKESKEMKRIKELLTIINYSNFKDLSFNKLKEIIITMFKEYGICKYIGCKYEESYKDTYEALLELSKIITTNKNENEIKEINEIVAVYNKLKEEHNNGVPYNSLRNNPNTYPPYLKNLLDIKDGNQYSNNPNNYPPPPS